MWGSRPIPPPATTIARTKERSSPPIRPRTATLPPPAAPSSAHVRARSFARNTTQRWSSRSRTARGAPCLSRYAGDAYSRCSNLADLPGDERRIAEVDGRPDGDVEALVDEVRVLVAHREVELDERVPLCEGDDHVREEAGAEIDGRGHAQAPSRLLRLGLEGPRRGAQGRDRRRGGRVQLAAFARRPDVTGGAVEQPHTGARLEARDRPAHRRGRRPELARGAREPPALDDAHEHGEVVQVQIGHRPSLPARVAIVAVSQR